jgi:O-methyltransferase
MNKRIFFERMIIDSPSFTDIRKRFFAGEEFSENEMLQVGNIIPLPAVEDEWSARWGNDTFTMVTWYGIDNLAQCLEDVIQNNIEGDFIETGVWRGGLCILAKYIFDYHKQNRKVFVADSFEGLPKPDVTNYPKDEGDTNYKLNDTYPFLAVSLETVQDNFRKFNLLDDNVIFLKGWFRDTLPTAPIEKLCVLRLDGDMYEATINALDNLYPKLSIGGYCIIDDFQHPRCIEATTDYRTKWNITEEIIYSDNPKESPVYWKKEKEAG